ncbi:MAG: DUF1461 domain-containing protein [Candidatus Woesearchaeota archaeon]|nr:DUF1461 domain-containing protein [Candidatus Woesearchaeota archaeon]
MKYALSLTIVVFATAFLSVFATSVVYDDRHDAIVSYLKNPFASNTLDFLTEDEQDHMTDVHRLFTIGYILVVLALTCLFFGLWKKRITYKVFWRSGWACITFCMVVSLFAMFSFSRFWTLFHKIFFPQGNWEFPAESVLITLYPSMFFQGFVLHWLAIIGGYGVLALCLSLFARNMDEHARLFTRKLHKKRKKKKRT